MLAYDSMCSHMLAYASVCWPVLACARICKFMLAYAGIWWHMLAYDGICWHMLTYAGSTCDHVFAMHMLAILVSYAGMCEQHLQMLAYAYSSLVW